MRFFDILGPIPKCIGVACSGGVDSMAVLSFLKMGRKEVKAVFFHHNTETSENGYNLLTNFCNSEKIDLHVKKLDKEFPKGDSLENFWRNERYAFFRSMTFPIITAHHIGDVLETWIFTSSHGNPRIIPYRNGIVFRPFLLSDKQNFYAWNEKHGVPFIEDQSNNNVSFRRNYIRHNIVPHFKEINPGIMKVMRRKVREQYNSLLGDND